MTAIHEPPVSDPATPAPAPAPAVPVVRAPEPATAPEPPAPVRPVLGRRDLRRYGALMIGLFILAVAVQPVADGPQPDRPLWASAIDTVMTFTLLALAAGTVMARRWSLHAGAVTGGSFLALSLSCPVSGHHEYAAWWGVQFAAVATMTVVSAALLRRTR